MTFSMTSSEKKAIDTIRTLSMEGVQKAKSGHPGTAMALAPVTYLLYNERMKYDPADPLWLGRDRFILSIGHASMLIYSMIHLTGILDAEKKPALTLDDLKTFRQLGSRCAGHPEYRHTAGVEMTTGPLGAGCATSVGFSMAERWLAARYNKPGYSLFDSKTYVLCGDGDMMEGLTSEAASLAGHLKLANLCWIYDDNNITIEGNTSLAFSENVGARFEAYGWQVLRVDDVNDLPALRKAFDIFDKTTDQPTLIIVKSKIGYGSPNKEGSESAHGAPLGDEEVKLTKRFYGMDEEKSFDVAEEVYETFRQNLGKRGQNEHKSWNEIYAAWQKEYPELSNELKILVAGELPKDWDQAIETFPADAKGMASRASSGKVLNQTALGIPWFLGGSADLAPSNNTRLKFPEAGDFTPTENGRNFHFGIRENAMGAITNGMVLSGLRAYCATFFVFSDFIRPMIRLAALMRIPTIFLFTHDSIGVGEDGPTHQPIEHLAALRAIPNVLVFRPADANEVAETYRAALEEKESQSVLVMSRQNLPTIDRDKLPESANPTNLRKGAYILADSGSRPDVILMATGSEVACCLSAFELLVAEGIKVRVVSMPCWELFDRQPKEYRDEVLPPGCPKVAVELGVELGWAKYLGENGKFLGLSTFGASAPVSVLLKYYGITPENVAKLAKETILESK